MRIPKRFSFFAISWAAFFSVFCLIIPLGSLLFEISEGETWSKLWDPILLSVAWTTFHQSLLSSLFAAVFGLVIGLWAGKVVPKKRDHWLCILFTVPFGIPTLVVAMAWIVWLGRSGIFAQAGLSLDWAYSLKAVILAHTFLNIPLVALVVYQARKAVPENQIEAARTLGASRVQEFRQVIWPHIQWSFWAACAQVMCLCSMSFALVLILGGGPPVQTLETELYERLRYGMLDLSGATVCAFWEMILSLFPWILVLFFRIKAQSIEPSLDRFRRFDLNERKESIGNRLQQGLVAIVGFFFILPYFSIFNLKILDGLKDLFVQEELRNQIIEPIRLSLILAVLTGVLAVLTALSVIISLVFFKSRKWVHTSISLFFGLPSGISILVLGLGVWTAFGRWIDPFEGSFFAIAILQMTLFFPIAFRILWPTALSYQSRQMESALLLGASEARAFWTVEWPRWKGPLLAALAGVMGASLGEMGAVSLFYSEKLIPLPLLISRWMAQYRFAEAQVLSGLLFLLSIGLVLIAILGNPLRHFKSEVY